MGDAGPVHADLSAKFKGAVLGGRTDPPFEIIVLDRFRVRDVAEHLKGRGFAILMDLTCVDYLKYRSTDKPARFEVVYYFYHLATKQRVRILCPVPETDPVVPSLTAVYGSADWLEREAWDMYGIRFAGHPNLTRILMYEEFSGHPLRKDYPLLRQQPRVAQVFPGVPTFGEKPEALKAGEA